MRLTMFLAIACLGLAAVASAQTDKQIETKVVTVNGEVIRYEPGHVIVIRGDNKKEISYTLTPSITVPAEVAIGRRVTLYTEPGTAGATTVTRVTTTSVTPGGAVKRTTEETKTDASGSTTKTTTTVTSGKVEAYESGKTLTILRSDGSKVTYVINASSQLPADIAIGKTVTILPMANSAEPIVQTVTYTVVPQ
jgi:hypothetical protein